MYEMKDEYLTGIAAIDDEHRKLFAIAEDIYQLMKNDFLHDKYDRITEVLQELRDYTAYHFGHEEAYMESIGYKKLFTQKIQHNAFIEKIDGFDLNEVDEDQDGAIKDLLDFLTDWLVHHILEYDKQIGK